MRNRIFLLLCFLILGAQVCLAQRFNLFSQEMRSAYPSVVYDFLERYLYEIDSLQQRKVAVEQRLRDDKVLFVTGSAASAQQITSEMFFTVTKTEDKYYEVAWTDTLGNVILDLAFPMQYELLLGMPKVDIEKSFNLTLAEQHQYEPILTQKESLLQQDSAIYMTDPVSHYYVESLNNARFYHKVSPDSLTPIFDDNDKWHSAANLFQGCIDNASDYMLHIEQNLYGFTKKQYTVSLYQWLAYCQAMKLNVYFGIEEEREDGLKALLIAQSKDLGFNHMMSITIPDNFVSNHQAVLKAVLNAYIPTQNVKDLYQQYVKKPKKRI